MKSTIETNKAGKQIKVDWYGAGNKCNETANGWEEDLEGDGMDGSKWTANGIVMEDGTVTGQIIEVQFVEEVLQQVKK